MSTSTERPMSDARTASEESFRAVVEPLLPGAIWRWRDEEGPMAASSYVEAVGVVIRRHGDADWHVSVVPPPFTKGGKTPQDAIDALDERQDDYVQSISRSLTRMAERVGRVAMTDDEIRAKIDEAFVGATIEKAVRGRKHVERIHVRVGQSRFVFATPYVTNDGVWLVGNDSELFGSGSGPREAVLDAISSLRMSAERDGRSATELEGALVSGSKARSPT